MLPKVIFLCKTSSKSLWRRAKAFNGSQRQTERENDYNQEKLCSCSNESTEEVLGFWGVEYFVFDQLPSRNFSSLFSHNSGSQLNDVPFVLVFGADDQEKEKAEENNEKGKRVDERKVMDLGVLIKHSIFLQIAANSQSKTNPVSLINWSYCLVYGYLV